MVAREISPYRDADPDKTIESLRSQLKDVVEKNENWQTWADNKTHKVGWQLAYKIIVTAFIVGWAVFGTLKLWVLIWDKF